jgi:hypothetical protein
MSLTVGYAATTTGVYTVTGFPASTVTKTSGNAAITGDNTAKRLNIAAGLAVGSYPVVLTADNGILPNGTLTFTLTVSPVPNPATAPYITGTTYMSLTVGYAATSTAAYTVSGTSPVTVTKVSGHDKITWDNVNRKLDIAAGLPVGVYEVKLRATNAASSVHTFTFTLTVEPKVYYLDIPTSFVGGTVQVVTKTPYRAEEGETVTLIITPDAGYELESIVVYDYHNNRVVIPLSGTGLTHMFKMPAHHVTIVAVFRSTATGNDVVRANNYSPLRGYAQNGVLHVIGLSACEMWYVYNITGTLIYQGIANDDTAEIALSGRGVYIIRSGDKTVKVVN